MATKNLEEAQKIQVAEVQRLGDKILIPEEMTIAAAVRVLQLREIYEETKTNINASFDAFPWDGALALFEVLKRKFGWASMESVWSWFGEQLPTMMEIEIGVRQMGVVPWGRLTLFQKEGFIDTAVEKKGNRYIFQAQATVKRKYEKEVREIYEEVRKELAKRSIYRGKALSIRFRDDDGEPLKVPMVAFVDTANCTKESVIYSDDVQAAIDTNLFTPITRMEDCKRCGIPVKRGILLAGDFGVGKTLAAKVAAALAVEYGKTFIYCKRTDEFAEAIEFAQQYGPAIVFCEDIDRVVTGVRTDDMDALLNIIDGVDTKTSETIIVLTTNEVEKINPAVLRPGRLDAVIEVKRPDAKAVQKLVKLYGQQFVDPKANLETVGKMLEDNIPAVIEEVVKRAKLSALKHAPVGTSDILVTEIDVREAAATMKMQLDLLAGKPKDTNGKATLDSVLAGHLREVKEQILNPMLEKADRIISNQEGE